jgi:hypothetical protein
MWVRVAVVAVVAVLAGLLVRNVAFAKGTAKGYHVPQNSAMEDQLGVRFSRVAVVGDGGLLTVTYVVLDSEKASRFQSDVTNPPVLSSESRTGGTKRVSLMKQGHTLRNGQTYYLVYENTRGAIRHGERVTITYEQLKLEHVPVL